MKKSSPKSSHRHDSSELMAFKGTVTSNQLLVMYTMRGPQITHQRAPEAHASPFTRMRSGTLIPAYRLQNERPSENIPEKLAPRLPEHLKADALKMTYADFLSRFPFVPRTLVTHLYDRHPDHPVFVGWATRYHSTAKKKAAHRDFYKAMLELPEFEGDEGVAIFHAALREDKEGRYAGNAIAIWNDILSKKIKDARTKWGLCFDAYSEVVYLSPAWGPTKLRETEFARVQIDEERLRELYLKLCGPQAQAKAVEKVEAFKKKRLLPRLLPAFTDEKATQCAKEALAKMNPHSIAGQIVRVALAQSKLEMVLTQEDNVNPYYYCATNKKVEFSVAGFSRNEKDEIYASGAHRKASFHPVLLEELLHVGFKHLYKHTEKTPYSSGVSYTQNTYPNAIESYDGDKAAMSVREALFLEAMQSDINHIGGKMDIFRADLILPKPVYSKKEFHAELLVKILKLKELGRWTEAHADRYRHLDRYIETIVAQDAASWHGAMKKSGDPNQWCPDSMLSDIDIDDYRRQMPPIKQEQKFKGQPLEKTAMQDQTHTSRMRAAGNAANCQIR